MSPKGANEIANSVDPDQTALEELSDLVCTVCLGLSVPILRIITQRCYGIIFYGIIALDRISCALVWSFVVMNLTLSGIKYKISKSVTIESLLCLLIWSYELGTLMKYFEV